LGDYETIVCYDKPFTSEDFDHLSSQDWNMESEGSDNDDDEDEDEEEDQD
jgi:hypothetical protein